MDSVASYYDYRPKEVRSGVDVVVTLADVVHLRRHVEEGDDFTMGGADLVQQNLCALVLRLVWGGGKGGES